MEIKHFEIKLSTSKRRELINITNKILEVIEKSRIKEGICLIFVPHATASLIINEDEPNIRKDYLNLFEKLVPQFDMYEHNKIDNNADSHLLSTILKPFIILPIHNGNLIRGTWQEIFFVELDGPRGFRKVIITLIGKFSE